ncbi:MAG: fumarylacetoacetase, partial [Bacteroidetes bacterium]
MNQLTSWVNILPNSDFSIYNLPFGVFKTAQNHARIGIRIGDFVLDLALLADQDYFDDLDFDKNTLRQSALNSLIACGKKITVPLREKVQNLLQIGSKLDQNPNKNAFLVPIEQTEMLLPVQIGDYTDFYASIDHATNVGKMFRPDEPLLPNWKHLPIAYHGRASSIVPSGTKIIRPKGQIKPKDQEFPS